MSLENETIGTLRLVEKRNIECDLKVTASGICFLVFSLQALSVRTSSSEVFVFFLLRSRSLTMVFLPNLPLSVSLFKSLMRMTTGLCSWRRSIRSSSRSGRGRREREPQRETRCIGSLHQTVMRDLMPKFLTASRREMKMESSSSSPKLAWCLQRSFLLLENTTF